MMGPISITEGPAAGQAIVYFNAPWGLQLEAISYPKGMAYDGAIGHEDEEIWAKLFDRAFPFDGGGMDGRQGDDPVELGFQASSVPFKRDVVQSVAPRRLIAGQSEKVAQRRGEDAVALVNHLLRVAQEMGEADLLVLLRPAGLGAVAIGDPDVRTNLAKERPDRLLGASGMSEETGVLAMVENPQPPTSLANP